MHIGTEPSTSSNVTRVSDPNVTSIIKRIETAGPSLRRVVVIRRTTPSKKVVSFQTSTDRTLNDPTSFLRNNLQSVQKKYSKGSKKAKNFLEDTLSKECGILPFSDSFENMLSSDETDPILYRLFISSAYTINNYFGKKGPLSVLSSDLYMYIHKLFPIGKNNQTLFYEIAKDIKSPEFQIHFTIVEASGMKRINSLGNLFCKVWMNRDPKWIEMTNIVEGSTRPIWNTRFFFHAENLKTDAITIEMYETGQAFKRDHDSNIKTSRVKKLFKRLSGICECDEQNKYNLVGKIEIRVRDVYSEGVDEWIPLICPNDETESIFIHIEAKFRVPHPENRSEGLKRHLLLMRTCIDDSLKNMDNSAKLITSWEQLLSRSATTLIFLHSVICYLTSSEDAVSRFAVLVYMGQRAENISIEFLHQLLLETTDYLKKCPDDVIEKRLQLMFEKETKDFYKYCFQFVSSLHSRKLATEDSMLSEFEFALRSIYLCEDVIDVAAAPLMALKSESINWLDKKADKLTKTVPSNRAIYLIHFLDRFMQYQRGVDEVIQKVLPHETLTHLIYTQIDDKLLEPLKQHTTEFNRVSLEVSDAQCKDLARKEGIELFSKIKDFVFYISKTTSVPVLDLKLGKFREWFGRPIITDWYQWRQVTAEEEIENAVKNDYLQLDYSVPLDQRTKLSISAGQTCEIIHKSLKDLWSLVSIPRAQKCDEMFVNSVHSCCIKYANLLIDVIPSRKLLEEFQFDGKRCLCVLLNNIWFVATSAESIIEDTLGTLPPNLPNCRQSLEDFCEKIISLIIDNLMVDIKYLTESIIEGKQVKENEDTLTSYSNYMRKTILKEIFRIMSSDVYIMFLKCTSKHIIELLRQCVEKWDITANDERDSKCFFELLLKILNVSKEICSIPHNLEENEQVWDENYTAFLSELKQNL